MKIACLLYIRFIGRQSAPVESPPAQGQAVSAPRRRLAVANAKI